MLGGRQNGAGPRDAAGGEEGGYGEQQPRGEAPRRAAPPPRAPAPAPRAPAAKSSTGFDDMDDDIPFCSRLLAVGIQRRRPAWAAGRSALKIERAPDRAAALGLQVPATPAHTPSSAP